MVLGVLFIPSVPRHYWLDVGNDVWPLKTALMCEWWYLTGALHIL